MLFLISYIVFPGNVIEGESHKHITFILGCFCNIVSVVVVVVAADGMCNITKELYKKQSYVIIP